MAAANGTCANGSEDDGSGNLETKSMERGRFAEWNLNNMFETPIEGLEFVLGLSVPVTCV